jgi:hypothetical protein
MSSNSEKLYEYIGKMILGLEEDIEGIADLADKKDVTSILNKLVALLLQLGKLSKEEKLSTIQELTEEDIAIIENFVKR